MSSLIRLNSKQGPEIYFGKNFSRYIRSGRGLARWPVNIQPQKRQDDSVFATDLYELTPWNTLGIAARAGVNI